jgi:hypothetical protein
MSQFDRKEMKEMWRRWVDVNERAEAASDWTLLGDYYAQDAVYYWMVGHTHQFRAEGRQQIIDYVMDFEMRGFDGWTYPYEKVIIDDEIGQIVGYWAQITPFKKEDGSPYRTVALGSSWFQYGGNYQWTEQLDLFDSMDINGLFRELSKAGLMTDELKTRLAAYPAGKAPGTTPIG